MTGYDRNDPVARGDERTAERRGEDLEDGWRGGETGFDCFGAMVRQPSHRSPLLWVSRALRPLKHGEQMDSSRLVAESRVVQLSNQKKEISDM